MKKQMIGLGVAFVIIGLFALFWRGLQLDPHKLPSTLMNQKVPSFTLSRLMDESQQIDEHIFDRKVSLFIVWASWCDTCFKEHPQIMSIARQGDVQVIGMSYKDKATDAKAWLKKYGNPYRAIAYDPQGKVAIDWGVYGTPETFVIDKKGLIRYRHTGPLTKSVWETTLKPLVKKLERA